MRKYVLVLLFLASLLSCTKEGLPGPEGSAGPEGPPGSGGTGGKLRVLTYIMPKTATLSWEKFSETPTEVTFGLKYTLNGISSSTITLPDTVKNLIDEGNLLIYGQVVPRGELSESYWHQFNYASAGYQDIETYTYQLTTTTTRYRAIIRARMLKRSPAQVRTPVPYDQIKFVIIPQTRRRDLEVPQ